MQTEFPKLEEFLISLQKKLERSNQSNGHGKRNNKKAI